METRKWICLKKTSRSYSLDPSANEVKSTGGGCQKSNRQLTHLAFDETGERLLAADSLGLITLVELGQCMRHCKLGTVQSCTVLAFSPANEIEILVGSLRGDIQIIKINGDARDHCTLKGHKFPVNRISSYKACTLTSSSKEVIIWDLSTFAKIHQLRFSTADISLRKATFSSTGLIASLYRDCTMQVWELQRLEQDTKIDPKSLGLRAVRDYEFTKDGRAMVLAGIPNIILILNTYKWDLIKRLQLPDELASVKELGILPQPLDGGANKVLAILSSNRSLHFLDLSTSSLIPVSSNEPIVGASQISISPNGRYIAYVDIAGGLRLEVADTLLSLGLKPKEKVRGPSRPHSHGAEAHLRCVRQYIKEELNLERLLPILKEFGEYPSKHRSLIWATILELPRNRNAYATLSNKSPHREITERIVADYPLADRSKALFLATIVNCLVHWCPLLSQSTFLPRLVFPFLVVFQGNHVLAFEIIIFVLSNYCQRWFEYHPLPPLNVLAMLENVLSETDPGLLNFFCEKGITSSEYVWPLLQTMMSEVLSGDEWLILWDHLFSCGRPFLLLLTSLAYSICSRELIMSQLKSSEDFTSFYRAQGHVRVVDLLRVARRLDNNTPYHLHPGRYFRSTMTPLPKTGPYPLFLHNEYPKFLAEDSQLELQILRQQEKRATMHRNDERRRLKALEEKRLRMERENFLKEVDATRIDELRRCYEAKIRHNELSLKNIYTPKEDPKCDSCNLMDFSREVDQRSTDGQRQIENCQRLQDQVQKLEFQVQTLLKVVDSSTTTQSTICK